MDQGARADELSLISRKVQRPISSAPLKGLCHPELAKDPSLRAYYERLDRSFGRSSLRMTRTRDVILSLRRIRNSGLNTRSWIDPSSCLLRMTLHL